MIPKQDAAEWLTKQRIQSSDLLLSSNMTEGFPKVFRRNLCETSRYRHLLCIHQLSKMIEGKFQE